MAFNLFGFQLLTPKDILEKESKPSIAPPKNEGSSTVYENGPGTFGGVAIDFDPLAYTNEVDLINQYREMSLQPEVDEAVGSIINEMVVQEDGISPVSLRFMNIPTIYDTVFQERVITEFNHVLQLMQFTDRCYEIMRRWYVDGRLYYDMIIDTDRPDYGVVELREIDPRTVRPVREMRDHIDLDTGARLTDVIDEYFLYNPMGFRNVTATGAHMGSVGGVKVSMDRIAYVNSGIYTPGNVTVLSHLHKAIKAYNQLRMVEDAAVVYRVTRAPERRVFYVDVGDLPTNRVDQYVQSLAARYRNRLTYDSTTGELRDDRKVQHMLEDFWLPRRTGGQGTQVESLPGGENLGEMSDVDYFKRKLYRSLGIPVSRLESNGSQFQLGRTTEITRDEIQFGRFLNRERTKFVGLFDQILSRHLTLRGVIRNPTQWTELRQYIKYVFVTDSYFSELKRIELMKERLDVMNGMDPYVGKYVSEQYVRDNILGLTQEEQRKITQEMQGASDMGDEELNPDEGVGGDEVPPPSPNPEGPPPSAS